jgi:hypothetical protein
MAAVRSRSVSRVSLWILLIVGAFVCIFPFFWMLIGATLNPNDVVRGILIPGKEFGSNLAKATKNYNLLLFFFNSAKIALLTVVLGVTVNSFAAFGFEKYRSKARERVFRRPAAHADHPTDRYRDSPVQADILLQAEQQPRRYYSALYHVRLHHLLHAPELQNAPHGDHGSSEGGRRASSAFSSESCSPR